MILRMRLAALGLSVAALVACEGGGFEGDQADIYEPDDLPEQAQSIRSPDLQLHNHLDDPVDWFVFNGVAGVTYTLATSQLGAAADTVITVVDDELNTLVENDDCLPGEGNASCVSFTPSVTGSYYFKVADFNQSSGSGREYALSFTSSDDADLVMSTVSAPSSAPSGGLVDMTVLALNQGVAETGTFAIGLYVSADSALDGGDLPIAKCVNIPSRGAGEEGGCSSSTAGPVRMPSLIGVYYLIAVADVDGVVPESDETNNVSAGLAITLY